ncbi:MAG: hypothetical protein ACOY3P_07990, partial [Planctomycetota bacterium]
ASRQSATHLGDMQDCWRSAFPPIAEPWRLPFWLLDTHAGAMLGYPFGGPRGASTLTLAVCVIATIGLLRQRRWDLLLFCIAPLALSFVAAAAGRYPYGGAVRFQLFAAPGICLMAGLGLALLLQDRLRAVRAAAILLGIVALATIAGDLVAPAKGVVDTDYRRAVQIFWQEMPADCQVLCFERDLRQPFVEATYATREAAMYRCNQAILVPQFRNSAAALRAAESPTMAPDRPLVCAALRLRDFDYRPALDQWLTQVSSEFRCPRRMTIPIRGRRGSELREQAWLEVFVLAPKGNAADLSVLSRPVSNECESAIAARHDPDTGNRHPAIRR